MRYTGDECPFRSIRGSGLDPRQIGAKTMSKCGAVCYIFILVEESGNAAGFRPNNQSATPALSLVVENWVEHDRAAFTHDVPQDASIATVLGFDT